VIRNPRRIETAARLIVAVAGVVTVSCDKPDSSSTSQLTESIPAAAPPEDAADAAAPIEPRIEPPARRDGKWMQVSINEATACALRADGTVWCWGRVPIFGNAYVKEPRQVPGISNASAIGVGFTSTCVLVDKHASCWGWNYDGSVGSLPIDTHDFRDKPVHVNIREPLVAVAGGKGHTCALTARGAVWCWGNNDYGQVGVMPKKRESYEPNDSRLPTRVPIPPARAITAGRHISCALDRDEDLVRCWGDLDIRGSSGSIGPIVPPTLIGDLKHPTAIVASETQACALQRDSAPACWGTQIPIAGRRVTIRDRADAQTLHTYPELAGTTAIALAESRVCAITSKTQCFGWYMDLDSPILSADILGNFASISVGLSEACGLTATGELWCWRFPPRKMIGD
jgi:hypothetical protein